MTPRTLPELLEWRTGSTPDIVVHSGARSETWAQFGARVRALGFRLHDLGVAPGEAVAIMGPTTAEWPLADQAVLWAGGVSVGLYSSMTAEQIAFLLQDCGARVVFAGSAEELAVVRAAAALAPRVEVIIGWGTAVAAGAGVLDLEAEVQAGQALVAAHPDIAADLPASRGAGDTAIIIYTSGTTGRPKGAMLSHWNCVFQARALGNLAALDPATDSAVSFLPMPHSTERIIGCYTRIQTGIRTRFVGSMDATAIRAALQAERPTRFGSVPRLYEKVHAAVRARVAAAPRHRQRLFAWAEELGRAMARCRAERREPPLRLRLRHALADRLVLRHIRAFFGGRVATAITGAAAIDREVIEFFDAVGMPIHEGYGMTECAGMATVNTPDNYRVGTVGRALPGFEVELASDGEVLIRSESVFQGYLNLPDESRAAVDAEGWLHTGDIGELEDGWLRITDRKKNILVTSTGKNIAPAAIEAQLAAEPLLGPVLVVGDRQPYVAALLSLDVEAAQTLVGRPGAPLEVLARDPRIGERVRAAVERGNTKLARYERVRRYRILDRPLSIEGGELTPTLKVRRAVVLEKYAAEVAALYAGEVAAGVVDVEPPGGARRGLSVN